MTDALGSWIIGIAGAAVITAVAMTLTPEGKTKRAVSLVCGLMIVIALIKPLREFDYASFGDSFAAYQEQARRFEEPLSDVNEKLTGRIIEERCASYIVDKGAKLGITELAVRVTVAMGEDGLWYPAGATLTSSADFYAREELATAIRDELGILPEELIWGDS
ncbi:MAG: stage III sporulation protein AF [Oscillospiraceae bacterium]|jgi:hypothetical protein|nr:stage III sporulation protein AF [Oscillospiraceae bacterium]